MFNDKITIKFNQNGEKSTVSRFYGCSYFVTFLAVWADKPVIQAETRRALFMWAKESACTFIVA